MDTKQLTNNNNNNNPIIFIVGSTASGKTKLSLELARKNKNIEIINADSMQLYKGADIMTAKATENDQQEIKHHLFDIIPLEKMDFQRRDYFNIATEVISDIHSRGKIPLVVGGTNYYIESLLYTDYDIEGAGNNEVNDIDQIYETITKKIKPDSDNKQDNEGDNDIIGDKIDYIVSEGWESLSSKEKHDILSKIDPLMAEKVHPNDTKRVENYIKVYIDEGVLPSKKLMNLETQRKLRYKKLVIFWVKDQNRENLSNRISKRIYEMVDVNGVREILSVYSELEVLGPFKFDKGVLQSIGYKEFYEFYKKVKEFCQDKGLNNVIEMLEGVNKVDELDIEVKKSLDDCIKKLINATEQYAKRQITWIKNRLASNNKLKKRFNLLEFSDASKFGEEVVERANEILTIFLSEESIEENEEENEGDKGDLLAKFNNWKRHFCEVCNINLNGDDAYEEHLKSRKHRKMKEKMHKHKKNMEMKEKYAKPKESGNKEDQEIEEESDRNE